MSLETNLTSGSGGPASKKKWHSAPWWTAVGVLVAILALIIGYAAWQYPRSPAGGPAASPPSSSSTVATATTGSEDSGASRSVTSSSTTSAGRPSASASSTTQGNGAAFNAGQPYLSDIPKSYFVRQPGTAVRGAATMSNEQYPSSYSFRFTNCSNCTYDTELNLPDAYSRFTGTIGLTDESRRDNAIDGIVYFAVYSQTGDVLYGPQKVEFPQRTPFDIGLSGVTRVRLSVTKGTNFEHACWCDARFTK